jgi:hypothetical protein
MILLGGQYHRNGGSVSPEYPVTIKGESDLQDLLNAMEYFATNTKLPRNLKILENATEAKILITVGDLELIADKLMVHLRNFDSIRHAVIHKEPMGSAFVIIITKMINHSGYVLNEFSTVNAAKNWLKNWNLDISG